jgi:hypothetical protein
VVLKTQGYFGRAAEITLRDAAIANAAVAAIPIVIVSAVYAAAYWALPAPGYDTNGATADAWNFRRRVRSKYHDSG